MNTPWDKPPPAAHDMVRPDGPVLQDVRMRFGVTLSSPDQANAFANHFRVEFPRSSSTVLEDTAWFIFRCGAIDGHDASIQAAVAVKTIAAHKLVREQPRSSLFHDVEVAGPVPAHELKRAASDREDALRKAMRWGLLHHPLVEGAAAAQLGGRGALPSHASGRRLAVRGHLARRAR